MRHLIYDIGLNYDLVGIVGEKFDLCTDDRVYVYRNIHK